MFWSGRGFLAGLPNIDTRLSKRWEVFGCERWKVDGGMTA